MIRRFAPLVAFAALACAAPAAALADGTILVKFASKTGSGAKVAAFGDDVTGTTVGGVKVVDPQAGDSVSDALARYRARRDVLYAEPNRVFHLLDLSPPSDPGYGSQWALGAISALGGWSVFPGTFSPTPSVPIGIVDTGVDATHPDLGNVSGLGATCLNDTCTQGVPTDDDGHGTHVSGIAAATTNNGVGVAGLSYASPLIVPASSRPTRAWAPTTPTSPTGSPGRLARREGDQPLARRYRRLLPVHALQCGRAGAELLRRLGRGCRGQRQPARHACLDADLARGLPWRDRCRRDRLERPASELLELRQSRRLRLGSRRQHPLDRPGNTYALNSGTSMASPYVAGLVGLIRSLHPEASVGQVRQILALGSDKVGAGAYGTDPYGTCSGCTWEPHSATAASTSRRRSRRPSAAATACIPAAATASPAEHYGEGHEGAGRARLRGERPPPEALHLRYRVQDDSGRSSERVLVYRKTKL